MDEDGGRGRWVGGWRGRMGAKEGGRVNWGLRML